MKREEKITVELCPIHSAARDSDVKSRAAEERGGRGGQGVEERGLKGEEVAEGKGAVGERGKKSVGREGGRKGGLLVKILERLLGQ